MILCVYTRTYKHPFGAVSLENHDYYVYPPWTAAISSWEGEMDSATFCQGPELLFFTWATKYVASHVLTIIFFAFFSCSYRCITPKGHSSACTPDLIVLHLLKDNTSTFCPFSCVIPFLLNHPIITPICCNFSPLKKMHLLISYTT